MDRSALLALVPIVEARATNKGSTLHGPQHWRCVSLVGIRLARFTLGADPLVAFLFGRFHDSRRVNDGTDPDHGRRGARLLREERGGRKAYVTPPTTLTMAEIYLLGQALQRFALLTRGHCPIS